MDTRPPLHLYLLAHPKSEVANKLASALMHRFVEPPASGGLRIPVFFTSDRGDDLPPTLDDKGLNLDAAQHTIIVILADERMMRTVREGTGAAWRSFAQQAIAQTPLNASAHHVLPIALEHGGFAIGDDKHVLSALLTADVSDQAAIDRRTAEISFHIAARSIQLLEHGKVPATKPDRMKAPVSMFLSHAKADVDKNKLDPLHYVRAAGADLPIDQWFDAQQIATSQSFADAISAGVRDCSIMLAFQTDHYSSRPWCRREVLDAKRLGAHILIVDALESGETRSFPYSGNVPVIRWRGNEPEVDARRVIDRAVLEALRFKHNRAVLQTTALPGERVSPAAPEALTLANEGNDINAEQTYLYPDPPLGREEMEVLHQLRPKAHFITPLTKLAALPRSRRIETICISISESDDIRRYGLSKDHFLTLSDEVHLYLLLAGLKIAYGGALKGNFSEASNFTLRLFELVRAYSKLAEGVIAKPLINAIVNVAPWPLWLNYGDEEWKLFSGDVAEYRESARPLWPWTDDEIFPVSQGKRALGSDSPQRRYAWARGLTLMRKQITEQSQARLVIGGKLENFSGLVPGVVEEAWLSITQKQPIYLMGGFGGAARAVSDVMLGLDRENLTDAWAKQSIKDYDAAMALYQTHGGEFRSIETMRAEIIAQSKVGLALALNNGLDDAENRKLMHSTDAQQIAQLVLRGLEKL